MGGGGTRVGGKYVNPSEVVPKSLYWNATQAEALRAHFSPLETKMC